MAVTVVPNTTVINTCESTTGWTGNSLNLDLEAFVQGISSITATFRTTGANDVFYTSGTPFDVSNSTLRMWLNTYINGFLDTEANNGLQLIMGDGTNTGYWTVAGIDTYRGGWKNFVVDTAAAPDTGTQPTMTAITVFGFRYNMLLSGRNVDNVWCDNLIHGNGVTLYGGTAVAPFNFVEVASDDVLVTNAYGITTKDPISGAIILTGSATIGDSVGTNDAYMSEEGAVIIFADAPVSSNLYNLTFVGNTTGVTSISYKGSVIKSASATAKFDIIATDVNIDSLTITGCTIDNADVCQFSATAGQIVTNNVFTNSNKVIPAASTFTGNTVSNTTDTVASLLLTSVSNITNCKFIDNTAGAAIEIDTAGTYTLDNVTFSGNTVDIVNTSTGLVTVNATNNSNPVTFSNTNGGTTVINNAVTLTITGIRENVEIRIHQLSDGALLAGAEDHTEMTFDYNDGTNNFYKFEYPYDSGALGGVNVYIQIISLAYVVQKIDYQLTTSDAALPVKLQRDRSYNNPV